MVSKWSIGWLTIARPGLVVGNRWLSIWLDQATDVETTFEWELGLPDVLGALFEPDLIILWNHNSPVELWKVGDSFAEGDWSMRSADSLVSSVCRDSEAGMGWLWI